MLTASSRPTDLRPLERALERELGVLGVRHRDDFHFLGCAQGPADVGALRLYRHARTHRYLVLDARGRAFRYDGRTRTYGRIAAQPAIRRALAEELRPTG